MSIRTGFFFVGWAAASVVYAQTRDTGRRVSFGLIGGASLTADFQNSSIETPPAGAAQAYSTPKRWIAGGTVEVRLPAHLSVEAEALYHELGFTNALLEHNGTLNSVSPPLVKPFIDAGPAFRSATNLNETSPSNHGLAAGLGVEVRLWKLNILPQFRYLRWARDHYSTPPVFHPDQPYTVPDQVDFLTAITF